MAAEQTIRAGKVALGTKRRPAKYTQTRGKSVWEAAETPRATSKYLYTLRGL